jgi:hypothetical protein
MAFQIGTSLGHEVLMDDLKTFLIAQSWTVEKDEVIGSDRFVYFKGPDILTGTTTINAHVHIRVFEDVPTDYYNWELSGAIDFDTNETFDTQPQTSPKLSATFRPTIPLFQNNIDYWFVANNRRFIVIPKVSTVFVSMYAGFLLPYATPSEFPFPFYIGATTGLTTRRYSDSSYAMGGFWDTPGTTVAYIRHVDGSWLNVGNYAGGGSTKNRNSGTTTHIWPYRETENDQIINNIDGSYTLYETIIASSSNSGNVYGELEGVFSCSGFANASENTVTIAGVTYLVVESPSRPGVPDFTCIRLD